MESAAAVGAVLALYVGLLAIHPIGRRWLRYWHGEGEAHQYQFFRCHACRRLVTHRHISVGGCACRGSIKISPAALRWRDKARLLYLPWTVTSLRVRLASVRRLAGEMVGE